jgi:hypothetical protein
LDDSRAEIEPPAFTGAISNTSAQEPLILLSSLELCFVVATGDAADCSRESVDAGYQ